MDKIVENLTHSSEAIHLNEGDIKEFYFKELDYLLDRIKWYDNLRATTLFFSATASITIIGISISNNKSIFMWYR